MSAAGEGVDSADVGPERFDPAPAAGMRALRRQHVGAVLVTLELFFMTLAGLAVMLNSPDPLSERWVDAALKAAGIGLLALVPLGITALLTARSAVKVYRRSQEGVIANEGQEAGLRFVIPATPGEGEAGLRMSVFALSATEALHFTPTGLSGWKRERLCAAHEIEEVVIEPKLQGGVPRDLARMLMGTRHQLTLIYPGGRSSWEIEPLFPPELVASWFQDQGFRVTGRVDDQPLGGAPGAPPDPPETRNQP